MTLWRGINISHIWRRGMPVAISPVEGAQNTLYYAAEQRGGGGKYQRLPTAPTSHRSLYLTCWPRAGLYISMGRPSEGRNEGCVEQRNNDGVWRNTAVRRDDASTIVAFMVGAAAV